MIKLKTLPLAVMAIALCSCMAKQDIPPVTAVAVERPTIKPELDFSDEKPDCTTAGARLAEHIEIGMTLDDVIRLVGKPSLKLPGFWWWSGTVSKEGRPMVKFPIGRSQGDVVITELRSDTSSCAGN